MIRIMKRFNTYFGTFFRRIRPGAKVPQQLVLSIRCTAELCMFCSFISPFYVIVLLLGSRRSLFSYTIIVYAKYAAKSNLKQCNVAGQILKSFITIYSCRAV